MSRLLRQIHLFEEIFDALQAAFPEDELAVQATPLDETFVTLPPDDVHPAARLLVERFDFGHLSTITGQDTGDGVELLYHFWQHYGITLRTHLPYDALTMPTLTDLIPGAAFYEREIYEMLGVTFEGHPNLIRLFAPDDWEGEHPLRLPPEEAS
jgi:NADH:ubiquinone oxidoreductase subunit C